MIAASDQEHIPDVGIVSRLNRDLRDAAKILTNDEARFLVDLYYTIQKNRIRANNQILASSQSEEPNAVLQWAYHNFKVTEDGIRSALFGYARNSRVGRWMLSIHGVGPVISAGMLAHIDIDKAPTAGHIWRFAGLDPTVEWKRKTKRPWNAKLKTLCWKTGMSFMKLRNSEKDFYGHIYEYRKGYEIDRNEDGYNARLAAEILASKKFGDNQTRKHLESGKLSPAHLDARARRYAVKLFLSHVQFVMFEVRYGKPPADPYAIGVLGAKDIIQPPNWPMKE